MTKVGVKWTSDGDIDIRPLPLKVKLKVLVSHTIDNSAFLSGDFNKLNQLKEEVDIKKIDRYVEAISAYLADPLFDDEPEIYILYDIDDKELVQTAIGHPQFSVYHRQFLSFNSDLATLEAYLTGVLLLRRIL
ncbi:hypothetical protein [Lysinibacillus xylanilyticus]|uniref:hypothetical protein n=1 Tax=Lysinibacillus xylanilyticus TaxID=582475 RepID=UPI0036DDC049